LCIVCVEKLYYYYNLYSTNKQQNPDNVLAPVQAVLGLQVSDCYDQSIVRKKYETWKSEFSSAQYQSDQHRERAQYLMSKIYVEYQVLLNRYKRFHQVAVEMEEIVSFKKKVKTVWQAANKNMTETNDDATFNNSVKVIVNFYGELS